jgi:hypothetical protein
MALWAGEIKFMTTLVTKFGPFSVLKAALRAFHFYALHLYIKSYKKTKYLWEYVKICVLV